jgi:hypothetical protein
MASNLLRELVHQRCGGRLRLVWKTHSGSQWSNVVCEKCKMLWDDPHQAEDVLRRPRKDEGALVIDEDLYPE